MKNEICQTINGPEGLIEMAYSDVGDKGVFVMCHPHPLYQGTMTNKVVTTAVKAFAELGFKTVRFNYRGVGKSEGEYGNSYGEGEDLVAVVNWARENLGSRIFLGGFSFGCFVAYHKADELGAEQLLMIAPSIARMDYDKVPEPTMPWHIIQGENDEVVSAQDTYSFSEHAQSNPTLDKVPDTTHFFHGQLLALKKLIHEHYQELV